MNASRGGEGLDGPATRGFPPGVPFLLIICTHEVHRCVSSRTSGVGWGALAAEHGAAPHRPGEKSVLGDLVTAPQVQGRDRKWPASLAWSGRGCGCNGEQATQGPGLRTLQTGGGVGAKQRWDSWCPFVADKTMQRVVTGPGLWG